MGCYGSLNGSGLGIAKFAGLENDGLEIGGLQFGGLVNPECKLLTCMELDCDT